MNRSEQLSSRTLSIFEILAAHFVNITYSKLHSRAISLKEEQKVSSITEGYIGCIKKYEKIFNNYDKSDSHFYNNSILEVYQYHIKVTRNNLLALDDYISMIVAQFVPEQFQDGLNRKQKYILLHDVLSKTISHFISSILSEKMLKIIIDDYKNSNNARMLQDVFVDILTMQRKRLFLRFYKKSDPHSTNNEMMDLLKQKVIDLVKNNAHLKADLQKSQNEVLSLKDDLQKYKLFAEHCKLRISEREKEIIKLNSKFKTNIAPPELPSFEPPKPVPIPQPPMEQPSPEPEVVKYAPKESTVEDIENEFESDMNRIEKNKLKPEFSDFVIMKQDEQDEQDDENETLQARRKRMMSNGEQLIKPSMPLDNEDEKIDFKNSFITPKPNDTIIEFN